MIQAWLTKGIGIALAAADIAAFFASIYLLRRIAGSVARHMSERYVWGRLLALVLLIIGSCVIAIVFMTILLVATYMVKG